MPLTIAPTGLDQVMADARTQQRRKIEGSNRDGAGHGGGHEQLRLSRMPKACLS